MTPDHIIERLSKRSEPAYKAHDVWLAQGYSLADLYRDIVQLATEGIGYEPRRHPGS